MRDWYNKGLVRKDGATLKEYTSDRKAGKVMMEFVGSYPDTLDAQEKNIRNPDAEKMSETIIKNGKYVAPSYSIATSRMFVAPGGGSNTCTVLNVDGKHKEKCMQMIELLNTDDDLYKLITQGEEGVDYKYDNNGDVVRVNGKYNFNDNEWQLGQSYSTEFTRILFSKNEIGEFQKKSLQLCYDAAKTTPASPVAGFVFDPTPVKTELINCFDVYNETMPSLANGCLDISTAIPEFQKKLKDAGADKIILEKQAQYDLWKSKNKK